MLAKLLRGGDRLVLAEARGEAEVVVALAEVAEALEVVDQEIEVGSLAGVGRLPPLDLLGQLGDGRAELAPGGLLERVREHVGQLAELAVAGRVDGAAVEE